MPVARACRHAPARTDSRRLPRSVGRRGARRAAPDWHAYFVDTRLQALIAQALTNNRDLRAAVARVDEARAVYGVRSADQWPTIGAGAAYARFRTPGGLLTPAPMIGQLYEVQLAETQWEIDFWGRVRSLKAAALQRYLASDAARQATTLSVVTGVANAYLTLCEIDERIVLTRATIDTRRESLRIFRLRYAAGAISRLDLTQSEILLQQAESLGVQLQQARATAADALALLVGAPRAGRSAARARRRRGAAVARARPAFVAARAPSGRDRGRARTAGEPREHRRGARGVLPAHRVDERDRLRQLGAARPADVGNGRVVADPQRHAAAHRRRPQPFEPRTRERTARRGARPLRENAAARSATSPTRSPRATGSPTRSRSNARRWRRRPSARLAKLRYDSGATRFLEVLDAQRDLMNAEQQLVVTRRALLSSRVALYGALGGGPDDPRVPPTAQQPIHSTDSENRQ
jgi:outer membrane protein TolC